MALALCGLAGALLACGREAEAPRERATLVRTAKVETGTITDWIHLYGRIVPPPDRDATLAPLVAGALLAVPMREGQSIRAGTVVARVEPAPLDDAVRAAEAAARREDAEAAFRRSTAARTRTLVEKGVASRQDAEADEAAAVAAEAGQAEAASALATARRRRAWADLRAPFDGVVVRVLRRAGDSVDGSPATPVVQMASPAGAQVAAEATADALTRIRPDQEAEIAAASLPGGPIRARVLRVSRSVDSATGSGEVRLALQAPPADLTLGLGVDARIAAGRHEGALVIPARGLRKGEDGRTEAVVVANGKAVVRPVATGFADGDRIEIVSGLSAGESVVVEDPVGLADGMELEERP